MAMVPGKLDRCWAFSNCHSLIREKIANLSIEEVLSEYQLLILGPYGPEADSARK
jgi:hypothetical protein